MAKPPPLTVDQRDGVDQRRADAGDHAVPLARRLLAHLDQVAMPGGDAAARQPWRMALLQMAISRTREFGADLASTRGAIEAGIPELASALRDACDELRLRHRRQRLAVIGRLDDHFVRADTVHPIEQPLALPVEAAFDLQRRRALLGEVPARARLDGAHRVLHFLVQGKVEPGNVNAIEIGKLEVDAGAALRVTTPALRLAPVVASVRLPPTRRACRSTSSRTSRCKFQSLDRFRPKLLRRRA